MTKPISRKMAVDCLLHRVQMQREEMMYGMPCGICGEDCLPGQNIQFDHIHSNAMDGQHEYQNLRPVHYDPCHKRKSAKDVAALAKTKRIIKGGRKRRGPKLVSKGFDKTLRRTMAGKVEKR